MIPVFKPAYGPEELEALRQPFESGWIGLGPLTTQFEKELSAYIGSGAGVATQSCTVALDLALKLLLPNGGEVITTPITFVSTNHAILYNKATPVFCDVEPDTLNMDASKIEALITPKTKGIVVVHYGGHACDMDRIMAIAKAKKLFVLEDNAHGCGGEHKGRKLGSIGDMGCFSFHAVKNLATGEGGMITLNNPEQEARLRRLRWMGISKDTWKRSEAGKPYAWFYTVDEIGYKYHMSDIAAALGLVQLKKLDAMNQRRGQLAKAYTKGLSDLSWIQTPAEKPYAKRSWHNYVIRITNGRRDALATHLQEQGIATSVHYFPNHLYDIYKPYTRSLPVAEAVWKEILTLPLFPDLTDAQNSEILQKIHDFAS